MSINDQDLLVGRCNHAGQAGEELAASLQAVLDAAPAIIWIAHDRECRVITGNRAAEDILRVPSGTNLSKSGTNARQLAHFRIYKDGVELESEDMPLQRVAASGVALADFAEDVVFDDGTTCSLLGNVTPILDENGQPVGAIAAFMDITDRKRAEEALRLQAALIDLSTDGIFVRRLDGTIIFWSRGAEALYGWSSQEAIGRVTHDLLHTRHPQPLTEIIEQLRQTGRWAGQLVHCAKDGQEIVVQSFWQAQFDERGEVSEMMESNVDVTERVRLLEAESAARRQAERANELRLRFLGMISHELRTPLQSIKGFTTTLLAPDITWGPDEQHDFLRTIDHEADKLTDMIEQLLDLSRMESGTLRIEPQAQSLGTILATVQPQLNALAAQHTLTVSLLGEMPPVCADGQRVAQVLTNLVSNAAKYAPSGTPIDILAERQGEFVRVSVCDEGPGISPEDKPYVFEAFRRGNNGQARQTKGAGLGLAICKGLVEAHGGSIWIENSDEQGTTAAFTLPVLTVAGPDFGCAQAEA